MIISFSQGCPGFDSASAGTLVEYGREDVEGKRYVHLTTRRTYEWGAPIPVEDARVYVSLAAQIVDESPDHRHLHVHWRWSGEGLLQLSLNAFGEDVMDPPTWWTGRERIVGPGAWPTLWERLA